MIDILTKLHILLLSLLISPEELDFVHGWLGGMFIMLGAGLCVVVLTCKGMMSSPEWLR